MTHHDEFKAEYQASTPAGFVHVGFTVESAECIAGIWLIHAKDGNGTIRITSGKTLQRAMLEVVAQMVDADCFDEVPVPE